MTEYYGTVINKWVWVKTWSLFLFLFVGQSRSTALSSAATRAAQKKVGPSSGPEFSANRSRKNIQCQS